MNDFISELNSLVWGVPLIIILVGTGLYLSFRYGFVQFRHFITGLKIISGKYDREEDPGELTHFQALSTALSATIGTGNIVGVAAAILLGGPGAVFWMWVTALVGMATKFTSCTLAVHFRKIDSSGESHGGPMHFIEQGLGRNFKWLAVLFSVFTAIASFGIGNMFQINNIAVNLRSLFQGYGETRGLGFSLVTGIVTACIVGIIIIGGVRSIGRVASKLVPFMALFYLGGGLIILLRNYTEIPAAFSKIFFYAFHTPEAFTGGLLGTVIRYGVERGLFSNEAGLGSAAIAHGAAKTKEPVREGLVAMAGPFIDTILVCSITALIIIVTDATSFCSVKGALTGKAFEIGLNSTFGGKFVSIAVILFAFSTLISWSYYGDRAADYLFGKNAVIIYRITYCFFIVLGACVTIDFVIDFCGITNGLMALPNLFALIMLSPVVGRLLKDFEKNIKAEKPGD